MDHAAAHGGEDRSVALQLLSATDARVRQNQLMGFRRLGLELADGSRRRIERDLHDGAQQRFVSLGVTLQLAERLIQRGDLTAAAPILSEAAAGVGAGIAELTRLTRGIVPDELRGEELAEALRALVRCSAISVDLVVSVPSEADDEVVVATYFVVSEALANVAKHAEADNVSVVVRAAGGDMFIVVTDDGRGGASLSAGSGLIGLSRRARSVGGRLDINSPTGGGTTVTAVMPLAAVPPQLRRFPESW